MCILRKISIFHKKSGSDQLEKIISPPKVFWSANQFIVFFQVLIVLWVQLERQNCSNLWEVPFLRFSTFQKWPKKCHFFGRPKNAKVVFLRDVQFWRPNCTLTPLLSEKNKIKFSEVGQTPIFGEKCWFFSKCTFLRFLFWELGWCCHSQNCYKHELWPQKKQ